MKFYIFMSLVFSLFLIFTVPMILHAEQARQAGIVTQADTFAQSEQAELETGPERVVASVFTQEYLQEKVAAQAGANSKHDNDELEARQHDEYLRWVSKHDAR